MLQIEQLTVDFGSRLLFQNINLVVKRTDKIGLAGRNGVGKSTLLKILAGHIKPSSGGITFPNDYSIGYLPQELNIESELSIFDEAKTALSRIEALEEKQQKITEAITTRTDYESAAYLKLIEDLNHVNDQLHFFDAHHADQRIEEILKGLGFNQSDLTKSIKSFSGGWQMRVELAKLLLMAPDLMLLDEPTNHLDIESIIWLEQFLKDHSGSIIMVSHDRNFLDTITNRTVEIINNSIEDYRAPYSKFLELREERLEKLEQAQKNQEREIEQMEENINKFRAKKNKAKFAQTLIRKLDKMERIEIDNYDQKNMNVSFPMSRRSGKEVVKGEHIYKAYGDHQVISDFSIEVLRGDRIAFVGKNGMGKSTMAKMIVGETSYEGQLDLGINIDLGYYAQHQNTSLNPDATLLESLEFNAPKEFQGKERSILGAFLFSGDDVDKKVKVLSGGEKARLALAQMTMHPMNVLVLDEPTNHLDLQSKEMLKQALMRYEGTLIIVSHDRNFLSGLTTKTFEFTEEGIIEHLGDVNEFLSNKQKTSFRALETEKVDKSENSVNSEKKELPYEERKAFQRKIKGVERAIEQIEKKIMAVEATIKDLDSQLQDASFYENEDDNEVFFKDYESKKKKLSLLYQEYEEKLSELERLKTQ